MRDSHRMRDGIDLHMDNRQIAVFVIVCLIVLGLVFSVGVLVGKQLSMVAGGGGGKPGDALAAIDAKEKARAPDSVEGVGEIPQPKPEALTFQKELTKPSTDTAAADAKKPAGKDEPQKDEAKKDEPKPADAKEPAKAADAAKPEEPAKAEPEKKDEPKKKDLTAAFDKAKGDEKAGENGGFTLQVASLPTQGDADKLVKRLGEKGLKAHIVEADVPNKGHVFRVRVGNYATRPEAEEGLKTFKKKSALPAIISNR